MADHRRGDSEGPCGEDRVPMKSTAYSRRRHTRLLFVTLLSMTFSVAGCERTKPAPPPQKNADGSMQIGQYKVREITGPSDSEAWQRSRECAASAAEMMNRPEWKSDG